VYNVPVNSNEIEKENTEEVIDATVKELCHILKQAEDEKFIYDFFKCLFTPPELKDFANRWLLVKELDKGTTQREIAKKYGMSLCKITRGSRELAKDNSAFRKLLDFQKSQSNVKDN
jgi:TrpR family trp operon transcriptional repressor